MPDGCNAPIPAVRRTTIFLLIERSQEPPMYRVSRALRRGVPGRQTGLSIAGRISSGTSWKNFDWRSVRHGIPNLDDRSIAHRNASFRPIAIPLGRIERAIVARQTVNENRTAGLRLHRSCTVAVVSIGI